MGGVCLDTNWRYWDAKVESSRVGWPLPTEKQPLTVYQRLAKDCAEIRQAGFTAIRLPPACRGASGRYSGGYDKWWDYQLNGTAFGDAEDLRQLIGVIHAHEMQAYGDLVLHQYGGGTAAGNYLYPGVGGKTMGRFPKTASCFVGAPPRVPVDDVPDQQGNFPFGDMVSYQHSKPVGYMHQGAIKAAQWLTATTHYDGYRIDDTKGTYAPVIWDIMRAPGMADLYFVGEYFDGNNQALSNWVWGYMQGRASTLDFGFHFNVGNICDHQGSAWMGALANIGYCNVDAAHAMTFIESADTDNSPGEQIVWNKLLGYAVMLTFPGYPCVYYRDWATDENCYGLKQPINNLIWIHEHLAQGDFVVRLDTGPQVFVHERTGYQDAPGCVCFFNNDPNNEHIVRVQTKYASNTRLHEYTGNAGYNSDIWTDWQGCVTVSVPRNTNGRGYVIYAVWIEPPVFSWTPQRTRQTLYGALDLPVGSGPALNGTTTIGRFNVAKASLVESTLTMDQKGWSADASVAWQIFDPQGSPIGAGRVTYGEPSGPLQHSKSTEAGWYTVELTGVGLPAVGSPYKFTMEYTAPNSPSF